MSAATKLAHIDWRLDPDWSFVILNPERHRHHHGGVDATGAYFCRECSERRMFYFSDEELRFMLLADRVVAKAEGRA